MPRSAVDRAFGFKAPGLVRILTAADPAEVLKALQELGLVAQEPSDLLSKVKQAIGDFILEPFEELFKIVDEVIQILEAVIITTQQEIVPGQAAGFRITIENARAIAQIRRATSRLDTAIADQQGSHESFAAELEKVEQQTEEDVAITFL